MEKETFNEGVKKLIAQYGERYYTVEVQKMLYLRYEHIDDNDWYVMIDYLISTKRISPTIEEFDEALKEAFRRRDEINKIARELDMKNISETCAICDNRGYVFETIYRFGYPYQVMKACSCHMGDIVAEGLKFFPSDTKREHPVKIKRIDI